MIAAHCEAQAAARHDLAVDGHGLRRDRTHGEDPRLRRIDHRGELIDVEHPQIRNGKGGARVLSGLEPTAAGLVGDRKSTRLNSSHGYISYAVFCLKKKKIIRSSHVRRI